MTMPNGLLSFKVMKRNMNSDGYIKLLDLVYDGNQFKCKQDLVRKITAVINGLNEIK